MSLFLEVTAGFEPADNGVADRGLTAWLRHHMIGGEGNIFISRSIFEEKRVRIIRTRVGADYGARTRHLDLGKVALYQMS